MPAHSRACRYRSLEVDIAVLFEGAEVRSSQGLGCDANSEGGFFKGDDGKTGAIYADAVAEMTVT